MSEMSASDNNYRILTPHMVTRTNPSTKQIEVGWNVPFVDENVNVQGQVFVPETAWPNSVATYIQSARAKIQQVKNLGIQE